MFFNVDIFLIRFNGPSQLSFVKKHSASCEFWKLLEQLNNFIFPLKITIYCSNKIKGFVVLSIEDTV